MNERALELTVELNEKITEDSINKLRNKKIPKGVAGTCEYCGYHSQRLVGGACAPCRDEFKLD